MEIEGFWPRWVLWVSVDPGGPGATFGRVKVRNFPEKRGVLGEKSWKYAYSLQGRKWPKSKIDERTFFGFFWFSMAKTIKNNFLDL